MTNQAYAGRHRLYGAKWKNKRARFLREHPLCCMCRERGRVTAATVVDHKTPHQGDEVLFWDEENWQPLCAPCHDRHKQRIERGAIRLGCTVEGVPLDAGHHWHQ